MSLWSIYTLTPIDLNTSTNVVYKNTHKNRELVELSTTLSPLLVKCTDTKDCLYIKS